MLSQRVQMLEFKLRAEEAVAQVQTGRELSDGSLVARLWSGRTHRDIQLPLCCNSAWVVPNRAHQEHYVNKNQLLFRSVQMVIKNSTASTFRSKFRSSDSGSNQGNFFKRSKCVSCYELSLREIMRCGQRLIAITRDSNLLGRLFSNHGVCPYTLK